MSKHVKPCKLEIWYLQLRWLVRSSLLVRAPGPRPDPHPRSSTSSGKRQTQSSMCCQRRGANFLRRAPRVGSTAGRLSRDVTETVFHGVLAPHAAWRSQIIPGPQDDVDHEAAAEVASDGPVAVAGSPPSSRSSGLSWSALLKRVFAIDVLRCDKSPSSAHHLRCRGGRARLPPGRRRGCRPALRLLSLPDGRDPTSTHTPGAEAPEACCRERPAPGLSNS